MDYKRILSLGVILFFAFFLAPFAWLKLILGLFIIPLCDTYFSHSLKILLAQLFVIFLFISEFLMTPFPQALVNVANLENSASYYIAGIIVLVGILWIRAIFKLFFSQDNEELTDNKSWQNLFEFLKQNYPFFIVLTIICILIKPTLDVDFSYGGDEHYHAMSIVLCQRLLFIIFKTSESYLFLPIALSLLLTICLSKRFKIKGIYVNAMITLFMAIVGIWLSIVWEHTKLDGFTIERALRYPCSEPWISSILGFLDYSYLENYRINSYNTINDFGVMRLLPSFSYMALSYLIYKTTRKNVGDIFSALITLTASTIPILLYESTLLYLEMPIVAVLFIVLLDSENIMTLPPEQLPGRISFYALISLQFLKEAGIIIAVALILLRVLYRHREINLSAKDTHIFSLLKIELPVMFISLTGGFIYLIARSLTPYRPYNFHPENILNISLWGKGLSSLLKQYHLFSVVLFLSIFYAPDRKTKTIVTSLAVAGIIWLFYFLEDPQWIGLARFNLLIAPQFICLAISIFVIMYKELKKKSLFITIISLLVINVVSIPFTMNGYRNDWGGSGERWYNWSQCLSDIKQKNKNAEIIVANMPYKYGFGLIFANVNWIPSLKEEKPLAPANEIEDFKANLELFENRKSDFLIYRYENLFEGENGIIEQLIKQKHLSIFGKYPSAIGGLLVVKKQTSE